MKKFKPELWVFSGLGLIAGILLGTILDEMVTGSNGIEFGPSGDVLLGIFVVGIIIMLYGVMLFIQEP